MDPKADVGRTGALAPKSRNGLSRSGVGDCPNAKAVVTVGAVYLVNALRVDVGLGLRSPNAKIVRR